MTITSSEGPISFVPREARPIIAEEIKRYAGTRWRDRQIADGVLHSRFSYLVGRARRAEIGRVRPKEALFVQRLLKFFGLSKDELLIR